MLDGERIGAEGLRQLIGVKCRIGNPPLSLMGDLTIARILRPKRGCQSSLGKRARGVGMCV